MRRSVRWTLFASVLAALALVVAACGGSDNSSSGGGGERDTTQRHRGQAGKKGGTLTFLAAADVDYLDPGQTYYTFGYMVAVRDQPHRCTRSSPTTGQAGAGPRRRRARDLRGQQDDHGQASRRASSTRPPVNREVTTAGHQVRHRARVLQGGPQRLRRRPTSARSSARRRRPTAATSSRSRASRRPTTTTIVFKLKTPSAPLVSQALVMPITDAGARGVREEVRREARRRRTTSTSPSPARTWSRTTPDGQGHRPRRRASRSRSSATRTGTRRPTTARPTSTRSRSRRATTTWRPPSRRALNGSATRLLRHRPAAGPGPQAGARAATRTRSPFVPARRHALHLVEHHDQAVRQHQRPQGDHRRLRPQRAAPDARRRGRRRHRQRLHPAGHPRLRGGRRPQAGRRPGLPGQPRAATRRWPRSTCWRPRSRTRACRSTPTASGPAATRS